MKVVLTLLYYERTTGFNWFVWKTLISLISQLTKPSHSGLELQERIFTAHIRSTIGGYVFTCVCLSTGGGGGLVPGPFLGGDSLVRPVAREKVVPQSGLQPGGYLWIGQGLPAP